MLQAFVHVIWFLCAALTLIIHSQARFYISADRYWYDKLLLYQYRYALWQIGELIVYSNAIKKIGW